MWQSAKSVVYLFASMSLRHRGKMFSIVLSKTTVPTIMISTVMQKIAYIKRKTIDDNYESKWYFNSGKCVLLHCFIETNSLSLLIW